MDAGLLATVSNTPGIPGFEDRIQDFVAAELEKTCDEVRRDHMGNVIGLKKATIPPAEGKRPLRVLMAAHADEVGMMVNQIDGEGFIRFRAMGGLNAQAIASQLVTIHGKQDVRGVVVPKHVPDGKMPAPTDLYIDTGLPKDEVNARVEVGDIITFAQELVALNEKVYMGRNFDDRIGTYCIVDTMRQLGDTAVDVYAVSSTQEEVGLRGIPSAVFTCDPDIGIALDGSLAIGPYTKQPGALCEIGKGTGIYLVDKLTIGNPKLVKFLFELGKRFDITCQKNIGGGTDASAMQKVGRGAMATTVGAPVRYMHTTVQLCHADDIDATVQLMKALMENAQELIPEQDA